MFWMTHIQTPDLKPDRLKPVTPRGDTGRCLMSLPALPPPNSTSDVRRQAARYPESMQTHILNVTIGALAVVDEQLQNNALHKQTGL